MRNDCDGFGSALPDWLEGELTGDDAAAMSAHAESCASCGALARDLRGIAAEAATLPQLAPARDLWEGIEQRIAAPVHSLADVRRRPPRTGAGREAPRPRWWVAAAAAAALIVTAGSAYVAGVRSGNGDVAGVVATESSESVASPNEEPSVIAADQDSVEAMDEPADIQQRPGAGAAGRRPAPAAVASDRPRAPESVEERRRIELARARAPMEQEFDREIRALRSIVDERRGQLDSTTVAVIERSLRMIDQAIAESREALAMDPASGFLNEQLNYALTRKVELLQTAASLPPRT